MNRVAMMPILSRRIYSINLKTAKGKISAANSQDKDIFFKDSDVYDPKNPFLGKEEVAEMHRINPDYVQYLKEQEVHEDDWFYRNFFRVICPAIVFFMWLWYKIYTNPAYRVPGAKKIDDWSIMVDFHNMFASKENQREYVHEFRRKGVAELAALERMEKKGRGRAVTIFENTNDKMSLEEYKKLEREREELEKEQAAKIAEENKKLVEYRQEQALEYQRKREEKRARILAAVEAEKAAKKDEE
ncbi:unnamed protein product [Oikopleura dioica]|uniref:Uncharacterized protein n=1 Tax=Oikopleura dioica TaxID=34765 RepID=E4Y973_OIKDI|nr:unnamed protein product [Oikopleura dioica]